MNFIPKIEYVELNTGTPKTVLFDSPPDGDPIGERNRANQRSARSTGGVKQTQWNYNTQEYRLEFIFQSQTVKDAFDDFWFNHASRGGEFDYYESSDEVDFNTFTLASNGYDPRRPIPAATLGEFEYDFRITMERVVP